MLTKEGEKEFIVFCYEKKRITILVNYLIVLLRSAVRQLFKYFLNLAHFLDCKVRRKNRRRYYFVHSLFIYIDITSAKITKKTTWKDLVDICFEVKKIVK